MPEDQDTETVRPSSGALTRYAHDVPVIGWREWLAMPSLGIVRIKAKIDTGARTSAIHAFGVHTFSDRGAPHVSFELHPVQRSRRDATECIAEIVDERVVTSSSGHQQVRLVIETEVSLAGLTWPIELTLAARDRMGFRMLLGREAIQGRFLVDGGRSFIAGFSHADVSTLIVRK